MAASAIIVSSDSFDESVGSPPSRVILFGDIPTVIHSTYVIAPETSATAPVISSPALVVETTIVASPTGLCGLILYSDSPDEMASLEYVTLLPATSPFLFIDSFEDSDPSEASDSSEAPPSLLTARKRVGPFPARRLARRCVLPRSSDHHSSSSSPSSGSAPVHSSGEAFRRWCAAPLSTFYPPTTSESSSGDSLERPRHSSLLSAGPSRKRCRSPTDSVPSSTLVTGSLASTRANLLPPRKRFKDSYSPKTSTEEDTEIDTTETADGRELAIIDGVNVIDQVEVDPRDDREEFEASAGDTIVLRIDPRSVPRVDEDIVEPVGGGSSSSSGTRDGTIRSVEDMPVDLDDSIRDFYHHMSEVRVDRIVGIETTQR
nr:hypothetical protein [Tanacetum cinerariifolium]